MKVFAPKLNGYNLQESGNYFMDNVIYFHDLVLCILFFILILVTWFLFVTLLYFGHPGKFKVLCIKIDEVLNILRSKADYWLFMYHLYKFETSEFPDIKSHIEYIWSRVDFSIDYEPDYMFPPINLTGLPLNEFLVSKGVEYRYYFYSDVKLEFIWTLFPSLVLLLLAIPSFGLLFSVEKVSAPEITIKVIGHQWYWEYQYMDFINYKETIETEENIFVYLNKEEDNYIVESYMIADEDLDKGQLRLLEVDKKLVLPSNTSIRLLITSDDVLHSWAVPALGIKVDACPGRINELVIKIREDGVYYGQCSELCGWYHGFMPIVIQAIEPEVFKVWAMNSFLDIKYLKK